jgi:uncharacterized protein YndB with AHSA1/START domain
MRFANTISIRAKPTAVFEYLAQFENVPRWNYAIAETRKTAAGPVAVGATYRQRRTPPRPAEEAFEVIEFEPPVRLAIRGDFGPFSGVLRYTLAPDGEGTLLTNEAELAGRGVASLLGAVTGGRVRDAMAANLGELKAILEGARP